MAQKKKATSKTLGKKDLKKTKGGLNFAITGNNAINQLDVKLAPGIDPASLSRFK